MNQPTQNLQNLAYFFSTKPRYVIENWQKIIYPGNNYKAYCKCINVKDRAVNITNDQLLIRAHIPFGVEDGSYTLSVTSPRQIHPTVQTPEFQNLCPDFNGIKAQHRNLTLLSSEDVSLLLSIVSSVGEKYNWESLLTLSCQGVGIKDTSVFHPFNLNVIEPFQASIEGLIFSLKHALSLAPVYFVRHHSDTYAMPIFIGKDWGDCVMLNTRVY